mgnify:CR=1 FL=1
MQKITDKQHLFDDSTATTIFAEIDAAKKIMLVMHQKPDGDTTGSALGMAHYLDTINKPHTVFCVDPLPEGLHFLPGKQKVETGEYHWSPDIFDADLVIVFDGGDLEYVGVKDYIDQLRAAGKAFRIINIDHHATNSNYGDVNLVVRNGSSTCEIVSGLLEWKGALGKKSSECLMTGLITDTGHFMNLATTGSSVDTASDLLKHGVNLADISKRTMNNRSLATLRLWGKALERLQKTRYGLVYTVVTQADIAEAGATSEAVEGISNFLNSLDQEHDSRGVLVLTEKNATTVKGSLRTTHPDMDVSKLAQSFGGGGHKKAAGFQVAGTLTHNIDGSWSINLSR